MRNTIGSGAAVLAATVSLVSCTLVLAQSVKKKELEKPEVWTADRGDRIHEPLPYLQEQEPETQILLPLREQVKNGVYAVGDIHRGDLLRLRRVKDYVLVEVRTFVDPSYRGRITVGGPRIEHKGVTLFYGPRGAHGDYFLHDEIRVFFDPSHDLYPRAVIRFLGPDRGVVYLDPMATGTPQAIVNFSSAPAKP